MNSEPKRLAGMMLIAMATSASTMVVFFQFMTLAMIGRAEGAEDMTSPLTRAPRAAWARSTSA